MQSKYLSFTVPVIHGYVYALREVWFIWGGTCNKSTIHQETTTKQNVEQHKQWLH